MGEVVSFIRGNAALPSGQPGGRSVCVSLSPTMERDLRAICREGYTAAGYLRSLLEHDLEARKDSGWTAVRGWPAQSEQEDR